MSRTLLKGMLMGCGMLSLVIGIWVGLVKLGISVPLPASKIVLFHGALMVGGFLGTLIGLERAVALQSRWAYWVPILSATSPLLFLLGKFQEALVSLVLSSVGLVVIQFLLWLRHRTRFLLVMLGGAVCWLGGNSLWLSDLANFSRNTYLGVYGWVGFLLLTIVGERMELNRFLQLSRTAYRWLGAGIFGVIGGWLLPLLGVEKAILLLGMGVIAIAIWLIRFDIARWLVRQKALSRYIGFCLYSGYVWLLISGGIILWRVGHLEGGLLNDAVLHTFFVGFVFAMIFGHAPIIFPAILGIKVGYHPRLYLPLWGVHLSLLVRLAGDLGGWSQLRLLGGALNALAIVLFLANILFAVIHSGLRRKVFHIKGAE